MDKSQKRPEEKIYIYFWVNCQELWMSVIKRRSFFKDRFHFVSQVNFAPLKTPKYIKKQTKKKEKVNILLGEICEKK